MSGKPDLWRGIRLVHVDGCNCGWSHNLLAITLACVPPKGGAR